MSIFRDLLAIKSFRENKAEIAVRKQRQVVALAETERQAAERRLAEFRAYAEQKERELFDDLCRRTVVLKEILDVQAAVGELRGEALQHEKTLSLAEKEKAQQAQSLVERKVDHATASRMKEKFVELAQVHAAEALRESERKEDAEMEEVAETRRDRGESEALAMEPS